MVKKLRYLARFIVVCLLLKKSKQVKELIKELGKQIDDYVTIYDPEDQLEWQLVKNEINDFIEADSILSVDGTSISLSNRLNVADVPLINPNSILKKEGTNESAKLNAFSLQEIIIVGNCQDQVKLIELQQNTQVKKTNYLTCVNFFFLIFKIKFSELSLDMFRMLQVVEREPSDEHDNGFNLNSEKIQVNYFIRLKFETIKSKKRRGQKWLFHFFILS
jgi:hypothetical protein